MKKRSVLILVAALILGGCKNSFNDEKPTPNSNQTDEVNLWMALEDTTWRYQDEWAGGGFVFYVDEEGQQKAVHQNYGSGLYVTSKQFVDFQLLSDTEVKIENEIYEYKNGELVSETRVLTLEAHEPLVGGPSGPLSIEQIRKNDF